MPELPDVELYCEAVGRRVVGQPLEKVRVWNPFLVRTVRPSLDDVAGRMVTKVFRLGKRIVLALEPDYYLAIHLMIAGRLHWWPKEKKESGRAVLALLDFPDGKLVLTEQGSKRRAALHLLQGEAALRELDRGGLEPLEATAEQFAEALRLESHTLKRTLTDPHLFSGIGNAYSDEILHAARLSPLKLTHLMDDEEIARLYDATKATLVVWIGQLRSELKGAFPEKVTAFHDAMAVHGRFKHPCPVCGAPVQRIVYAENECNYCARCQTGGRVLADRSLSRLLKDDFPRSL